MSYRVGRTQPKNLYRDDVLVGQCQSEEVAAELVGAANREAESRLCRLTAEHQSNNTLFLTGLTAEEFERFRIARLLYSGSTGPGATVPYIATYLFMLPRAIEALGWEYVSMVVTDYGITVRKYDPVEHDSKMRATVLEEAANYFMNALPDIPDVVFTRASIAKELRGMKPKGTA